MERLFHLALLGLLFLCLSMFITCLDDDDDDSGDDDTDGCDTWTDSASGLMWQNAQMISAQWEDAIEYCFNLSCGGYDDWRVPTINELRSLIRGCPATEIGGSCGVSTPDCTEYSCRENACTGCEEFEGPALDGYYLSDDLEGDYWVNWSATEITGEDDFAWIVSFKYAAVGSGHFDSENEVRCVRGNL